MKTPLVSIFSILLARLGFNDIPRLDVKKSMFGLFRHVPRTMR